MEYSKEKYGKFYVGGIDTLFPSDSESEGEIERAQVVESLNASLADTIQQQVDKILKSFEKEPKQRKVTSYFQSIANRDNQPTPSTSAAMNQSNQASSPFAAEHLKNEDDIIFSALAIQEEENNKTIARVKLDLFWEKVEADKKDEHKQITYRHNIAKIKLRDRANKNGMKQQIADKFWAIDTWPAFIVEVLMSPTFDYNDRLTLATFFHGNGIKKPELPTRVLQFYNRHWMKHYNYWKQKLYKFGKLFEFLDKALDFTDPEFHRMGETYYYYSMIVKHMLYYNGKKRKNGMPIDYGVNHSY